MVSERDIGRERGAAWQEFVGGHCGDLLLLAQRIVLKNCFIFQGGGHVVILTC